MVLNNNRGQTMVEYILLLAVSISLVITFYNSATFRRLFGTQGVIGLKMKSDSEWAYRHAYMKTGNESYGIDRNGSAHPSLSDGSDTRFFGPKEPYQ